MPSHNRDESEEQAIRKEITNRLKQRDDFHIHVITYIGGMILLWVIWFLTGGDFLWPLIPMIAWGFGITAHGITYYNKYGRGREKRQARIDEETRKELERRGYYKAKNDDFYTDERQKLHLTEDGEIAGPFDDSYFDDNLEQGRK